MNQALKEHQNKLRLGLVTRPKIIDPIEKAEQNPNSLKYAIRAKCFNCSGFEKKEVTNCEMFDCELFNVRPWQKPYIKPDVSGGGTSLSKKPVMEKYGRSDKEIPQERYNSEGELLPPYSKLKENPKSLRAAINSYCFSCCSQQYAEVKYCPDILKYYFDKIESCSDKSKLESYKAELRTAKNCPLHHLRPWQ